METKRLRELKELAAEKEGKLSDENLNTLCRALCRGTEPAKRRMAAEALFHGAGTEWLPQLLTLREIEPDPTNRDIVGTTIRRLGIRGWIELGHQVRHVTAAAEDTVVCACAELEICLSLFRWCRQEDLRLVFAERESCDFWAVPGRAAVVDPEYVGGQNLRSYYDYCRDVAAPVPEPVSPDEAGWPPEREGTPVLLVSRGGGKRPGGADIPSSKKDLVRTLHVSEPQKAPAILQHLLNRQRPGT